MHWWQIIKDGAMCVVLMVSLNASAQVKDELAFNYWAAVSYGTPVLTKSDFNSGGELEIKVGGLIANTKVTLVGGLSNSIRSDSASAERFSPFIGPGYIFSDRLILFSMHTGVSYPFYRNQPEKQQNVSWYNAIDFGIRVVPKIVLGIGMNGYLGKQIPAYNLRFFALITI